MRVDPVTAAQLSAAAPVFTALGDETRLRIVGRLCREGPLSISRLTDGTRISRQAITKHLCVLADAGLVQDKRSGRERIWNMRTRQLDQVRHFLNEISAQWDDALARLQTLVEMPVLQDVIAPDLLVLFCGSAVGAASTRCGAYYAGPGNAFWKALYYSGLTPRQLQPEEYEQLLKYRMGLTDLAKYVSGPDSVLADEHFDREAFVARILEYEPRIVAFTGKRPAREFLGRDVTYGPQGETLGQSRLFVLPSPSANARRYWTLEPWRELKGTVTLIGLEGQ
jgi:TDG/mug DNA glycosylase family protein